MFLIKVLSQMLCEPPNNSKYGVTDSVRCFGVRVAVKIAM